jgi:hypothetical protein
MMKTAYGIEKLGIIGLLIARLRTYEKATGQKPTLVRLEENHRRTFREEARLLPAFDTPGHDVIDGVRIVTANHPDDIIIDSEKV